MAYFIYLTIIEMKEQRKESLKPFISFPYLRDVYMDFSGYENITYFPEKMIFSTVKPEKDDIHFTPQKYIEIENIGLGSAHTIHFSWEYSFSDLTAKINNSELTIQNSEDRFSIYLSDKLIYGRNKIGAEESGMIPHLLPTTGRYNSDKINLPSFYTEVLMHLIYILKVTNSNGLITSPSIFLTIEYSDLSNNKYKVKFEFQIMMNITFNNSEKKPVFISGEMFVKNRSFLEL